MHLAHHSYLVQISWTFCTHPGGGTLLALHFLSLYPIWMSAPPTFPLRLIKLPSFVHFVLYVLLPIFLFVLCFFMKKHRLMSLVFLLAFLVQTFFYFYLFIFSICNIMLTCIRPPPVLFTCCIFFLFLTQHEYLPHCGFYWSKWPDSAWSGRWCACTARVRLSPRLSLSFGCIFPPCTLIYFFNYC